MTQGGAQEGKTLLELLTVLVVLGILSALAGPSLAHLQAQVHLQAVTTELASELRLARQLAATRRDRVLVTLIREQQVVEVRLLREEAAHHWYRYDQKRVTIDRPTNGDQIVFYPSGRTATATTIRLYGRDGRMRTITVGLNGRVSIR
ncbi:MAG: GspH/FimT family protein [Nitrospira sp.]|nr:GspH/FimT family protein [Nitrospira sp.]MCP9464905.1 GspH/FimT family protein [Nitrospira sp.]